MDRLFRKYRGPDLSPIVLCIGIGRLHFADAIPALARLIPNFQVIIGATPARWFPIKLLTLFGKIIGHKNIVYGFRRRAQLLENVDRATTLWLPELAECARRLAVRLRIPYAGRLSHWPWLIYGRMSRQALGGAALVHIRSGAGCAGAIRAARLGGARVLVDHSIAHPDELKTQLEKSKRTKNGSRPFAKLWRIVLEDCASADHVVVNSEYVRDSFVTRGFSSDRISVVRLGVRTDFFGLKTQYAISQQKVRLLFVGTFSERKGSQLICELMKELNRSAEHFSINIIGAIEDVSGSRELRIRPDVHFFGHLPQRELKIHLSEADIFVFPSFCEGSAQSANEAMAAGLPVVVTRQTGAPARHFENALVFEAGDLIGFLGGVRALAEDLVLRQKIGTAAADTIAREMTWERYAYDMESLYSKLLAK